MGFPTSEEEVHLPKKSEIMMRRHQIIINPQQADEEYVRQDELRDGFTYETEDNEEHVKYIDRYLFGEEGIPQQTTN